jgi:glutathione synthase/RimK-type ligase-like ATP-grasp enzyme
MNTGKVHLAILRNESEIDHRPWIISCDKFKEYLTYDIIDITKSNWLELILRKDYDYFLLKPAGRTTLFKQLYDERIAIISEHLKLTVFPSYNEVIVYENKRFLSYWLKSLGIPHPSTYIFYYKDEAMSFIKKTDGTLVAKINIGASGKGIKILRDHNSKVEYVEKAFANGVSSTVGPKFSKGKLIRRAWNKITHPAELKDRLQTYKTMAADVQKGYCIFQEYIQHEYEWRAVRIGDSFFAHKKMKINDMASGTLVKGYDTPPLELLDFVKSITDRFGFYSQAVDIFETTDGQFLVNEMQCIFGQSDPYQMLVNGTPGRYVFHNNKWIFEEGDFASNQCYDLRVQFVLDQFNKT